MFIEAYYMPSSGPSTSWSVPFSPHNNLMDTVVAPNLQMKKLRLREVILLTNISALACGRTGIQTTAGCSQKM